MSAFNFDENEVCSVEAWGDPAPTDVAVRPACERAGHDELITWYVSAQHRRAFIVARVVEDTASSFTFVDASGRCYTLRPLTLTWFRQHYPEQAAAYDSTRQLRREALVQYGVRT